MLELDWPAMQDFIINGLQQPAFRAIQLWQWIWQKMETDFNKMTNVAKSLRAILSEKCVIQPPHIMLTQKSVDGTIKFLLELEDGNNVETVLIPSENRQGSIRWAQCLSSQVGCPMHCSFCATGQMGFKRNLGMGEILGQIFIGRQYLQDFRPDRPILRNLVFMGMGEPLLNLDALLPALTVISNEFGLNFSPHRVTVSTAGIAEGLEKLGESGLAYLAVSLHASNQELRKTIMPVAARWPLDEMIAALKKYPVKARERITFEYLLLGGINDSISHAKELVRIASQIKAKINLINWNPAPGLPYRSSDPTVAQNFQDYLCAHNLTAIMRKSKGPDISAACGQLHSENTLRDLKQGDSFDKVEKPVSPEVEQDN